MSEHVQIPKWLADLMDEYLEHDACVHRHREAIVRESLIVTMTQLHGRMEQWDQARPDDPSERHPFAGNYAVFADRKRDERLKELEATLRDQDYDAPAGLGHKVLTDADH